MSGTVVTSSVTSLVTEVAATLDNAAELRSSGAFCVEVGSLIDRVVSQSGAILCDEAFLELRDRLRSWAEDPPRGIDYLAATFSYIDLYDRVTRGGCSTDWYRFGDETRFEDIGGLYLADEELAERIRDSELSPPGLARHARDVLERNRRVLNQA